MQAIVQAGIKPIFVAISNESTYHERYVSLQLCALLHEGESVGLTNCGGGTKGVEMANTWPSPSF